MKWLKKLSPYFRPPGPEPVITMEFDPKGVTQTINGVACRIVWNDVVSVMAWKKDCYAYDQVRLIIADSQHSIECHEGDANFDACLPLHSYLPGSLPDWYQVLTSSPAFTPTVTRVFPLEEK